MNLTVGLQAMRGIVDWAVAAPPFERNALCLGLIEVHWARTSRRLRFCAASVEVEIAGQRSAAPMANMLTDPHS